MYNDLVNYQAHIDALRNLTKGPDHVQLTVSSCKKAAKILKDRWEELHQRIPESQAGAQAHGTYREN